MGGDEGGSGEPGVGARGLGVLGIELRSTLAGPLTRGRVGGWVMMGVGDPPVFMLLLGGGGVYVREMGGARMGLYLYGLAAGAAVVIG